MWRITLIYLFAILCIGRARLHDPLEGGSTSNGLNGGLSEPSVLYEGENAGDIELRDSRRTAQTHFVSHKASGHVPQASELKIEFAGLVTTAKASQARNQVVAVKTKGGVKGKTAGANAQPKSLTNAGGATNFTSTDGLTSEATSNSSKSVVKSQTSKRTAKQGQK